MLLPLSLCAALILDDSKNVQKRSDSRFVLVPSRRRPTAFGRVTFAAGPLNMGIGAIIDLSIGTERGSRLSESGNVTTCFEAVLKHRLVLQQQQSGGLAEDVCCLRSRTREYQSSSVAQSSTNRAVRIHFSSVAQSSTNRAVRIHFLFDKFSMTCSNLLFRSHKNPF